MQANGQPEPSAAPTFFDIISGDEDTTLRSIVQITNGVTGIVDKVQTLLVYWEKKYKHMWDQDKDAYIRYKNHLLLASLYQICSSMLCIFRRTWLHCHAAIHILYIIHTL